MRSLGLASLLCGVGFGLSGFGCSKPEQKLDRASRTQPETPKRSKKREPRAQSELPSQPEAPPRIGVLATKIYVRRRASRSSPEIGVLHIGTTVELAEPEQRPGPGCPDGFVAIKPRGFVCADRQLTTQPHRHPLFRALASVAGDFTTATPYRYAESLNAPLYRRLPDRAQQARWESDFEKHQKRIDRPKTRPHPKLRGIDFSPAPAGIPDWLDKEGFSPWALYQTPEDRRPRASVIPARSSIAWVRQFRTEGRDWLVTPELMLVPKDRVKALPPASFRGVRLGRKVKLPIAFVRWEDRPKYRATLPQTLPASFRPPAAPQSFQTKGEFWPRLSMVALTGKGYTKRGHRYLETREPGTFIRERDATVIKPRALRGVKLGHREKWIDIHIFKGTLVAYEGTKPVFATLISPGANGYKRIDGKPGKFTTPTGTFRLEWKHRSTTMAPNPKRTHYYLSEVPFTQFFHMPFALHAAYWHDRFGEPKSGGCINLSVSDAHRLFAWTEPAIPEGWHSVRSGADFGAGTWVIVR